ncbi:LLM class flavin-dependent oxidoreductase [Mycolicibacterium fluoranthenivorans]|uniref:Alkanesulfonate monooxygenase SsuD/methylene tetrahydromethanopterin reductase-like flavin-dependent oxidoreductase (Luciferase family) n=1 Tax=Mycolicibacterium fluoranthenivorans TaxID=258505 RepID=A0A7X5ZF55_9MYCO|nr:LLM class flavin-dependent oxidoreductase [Mycolicibacterium fluoranthenivorans]MCV7356281.1 LLM class flavin-dependent oxidoreductase [Mycolicibacterium fluoranthenivorans]NIH97797.1 alkanesulfonate monooxygenase SsuD/methylene tetrahydromethanopterin reductase-like flavin-dependent oxidoreductase (luciferase family) [Mycolicibacterium fluoranthenivorans]
MKLGIGLPNHIAGVAGTGITEWARRAEERGFESVTTIDRLCYPGLDSLISLAAAAGATTDVTLVTNVLLAPVYPMVPLAKQIAGVAQISGGRLVVGLGVGNRPDDYASTGTDFDRRGKILDEQVERMRRLWTGAGDAPLCAPVSVPLLFGGRSAATVRRVTTVGDGWAAGAVRHYDVQAELVQRIRSGWAAAGRRGHPYLQASVNFGLGPEQAIAAGKDHLARYYGFSPEYAQVNVDDMVSSPDEARDTVRRYRALGFDRLLFHPTTAGVEQLDRLADAIL